MKIIFWLLRGGSLGNAVKGLLVFCGRVRGPSSLLHMYSEWRLSQRE